MPPAGRCELLARHDQRLVDRHDLGRRCAQRGAADGVAQARRDRRVVRVRAVAQDRQRERLLGHAGWERQSPRDRDIVHAGDRVHGGRSVAHADRPARAADPIDRDRHAAARLGDRDRRRAELQGARRGRDRQDGRARRPQPGAGRVAQVQVDGELPEPALAWSMIGTLKVALVWPGANVTAAVTGVKSTPAIAVPGPAAYTTVELPAPVFRVTVITAELAGSLT